VAYIISYDSILEQRRLKLHVELRRRSSMFFR